MASEQHGDAHGFDMSEHEATWKVFNRLFTWGIVLVILILLFLMWVHFG